MCLCQCVYGSVCVWKEGGLSIIICKRSHGVLYKKAHGQSPSDLSDLTPCSAFEVKAVTSCDCQCVQLTFNPHQHEAIHDTCRNQASQSNPPIFWHRYRECLCSILILSWRNEVLHKQTVLQASADCLHNLRLFSFNFSCTV